MATREQKVTITEVKNSREQVIALAFVLDPHFLCLHKGDTVRFTFEAPPYAYTGNSHVEFRFFVPEFENSDTNKPCNGTPFETGTDLVHLDRAEKTHEVLQLNQGAEMESGNRVGRYTYTIQAREPVKDSVIDRGRRIERARGWIQSGVAEESTGAIR